MGWGVGWGRGGVPWVAPPPGPTPAPPPANTFTLSALSATCAASLPEVKLAWTPLSGATSYMIQRRLSPNLSWSGPALDSGLSGTTYTDNRWASSYGVMTYYYQVAALRSDGSRVYSNEVAIAVPNCKSGAPAPAPTPTPTPGLQVPVPGKMPAGLVWGAGVDWREGSLDYFESRVGHEADMQMIFSHWGNDYNFPTHLSSTIRDHGKTMVLFWEAVDYNRSYFSQPEYSYDAVLSGRLDNFFRNFAQGAKAYGGEVILIPYSEFNGGWFPWGIFLGGNSPQKHAEAFRYITRFFDDVPNVKFAWVPNTEAGRNDHLELAYPGDAYVDYVGVDGFNFGGSEEMTFDQLFGGTLTRLGSYGKPAMIFSMGTHAGAGKAAWITDALTIQLYKYPHVVGWLWFNEDKETDWRVWSDPQSLAAFSSAIR